MCPMPAPLPFYRPEFPDAFSGIELDNSHIGAPLGSNFANEPTS